MIILGLKKDNENPETRKKELQTSNLGRGVRKKKNTENHKREKKNTKNKIKN